jgi:hypothetical protein
MLRCTPSLKYSILLLTPSIRRILIPQVPFNVMIYIAFPPTIAMTSAIAMQNDATAIIDHIGASTHFPLFSAYNPSPSLTSVAFRALAPCSPFHTSAYLHGFSQQHARIRLHLHRPTLPFSPNLTKQTSSPLPLSASRLDTTGINTETRINCRTVAESRVVGIDITGESSGGSRCRVLRL